MKLNEQTNDNLVQIQTSVALEARILWGLTAHLILGQERWNFGPQPYDFYSLAGGEVGWQFASRSPLLGVRRLAFRWTDSKHPLRKPGNSSTNVEGTSFFGGAVTFEF